MSYTTGEVIRDARFQSDLSQIALAKQLGCKSQFIANIERGISNIPARQIKKICKVLKIKQDVLIDRLVEDYRNKLFKML